LSGYTTSFGYKTEATGVSSTAFGYQTVADQEYQLAMRILKLWVDIQQLLVTKLLP
jgi:hypothetical protein